MNCAIIGGIILILIGIGILIKIIFHIDVPIFKILIGLFFLYLGIKIILGKGFHLCSFHKTEHEVIFDEAYMNETDWKNNEKNVVFGSATIDLTNLELKEDSPTFMKINTVFGHTIVKIRKEMPVKVRVEAAFSGVKLPNGNEAVFGNTYYKTDSVNDSIPKCLVLHVSTVFSSFEIKLAD